MHQCSRQGIVVHSFVIRAKYHNCHMNGFDSFQQHICSWHNTFSLSSRLASCRFLLCAACSKGCKAIWERRRTEEQPYSLWCYSSLLKSGSKAKEIVRAFDSYYLPFSFHAINTLFAEACGRLLVVISQENSSRDTIAPFTLGRARLKPV